MQCPKCQHENPSKAKFCRKCGAELPFVCPKCGNPVEPDDSFCMECGTRLDEVTPIPAEAPAPTLEDIHAQSQDWIPDALAQKYMSAEQQATGENRPITALFADISGFTPLSNTQSSETMFQLVQDCFKRLVSIVADYEGSISGFRGDGLLALLGAPILHENDAERAILAAVDMRAAMQEQGLQISVGINTAMMTVGEIQTQLHREYTAYGTDVNLAKRLQEAAEPGQILVGTGTYRLTRRMFDSLELSSLSVKGFSQPVTAYVIQQVKERPEKLRGIEGLRARMIGREHEFADLKEAADLWLGGQGQIASVIGEAGIGKSRLVTELREYLGDKVMERLDEGEDVTASVLEGRCVSIGQPISYWPFQDMLRSYFGLSEDDDEATRARKVTESITRLMPQGADETLPLLGNLLSIKFGNELDDRLKFAGPEQVRHQTLMRLRDLFEALARKQPLLLILEDMHWADDLSLDLASLLMDSLVTTSLMLLCVYRPEREHRVWQLGDQARRKCLDRYTELILSPLSSHQSRVLVESLLEIENLPESVKNVILTKSEGNPFFIEEVIRSLIEQDVVYIEDDRWKARDEIANIHVPDTIQSVVLARVDRLHEEAKYILRCASVIGRLFRYRLLQHISQQEHDLDRHLSDFEDKELVYEERTVPELEYAFKHAFTQEATYEGILEQRRREFHYQVAQGIERLYQEHLDEYYEELAHHYSRSESAEKAVEYLLKAGEKAKKIYANEVAISHFSKALEMLEQYGIERNDWKLAVLRGLGETYSTIGKFAEAEEVCEEAITLAKEMGFSPHELVRLYSGISTALLCQGKFDEMIRYGKMGLTLLGDDTECLEAALMNSVIAYGYREQGNTEKKREYTLKNMAFLQKLPYSEDSFGAYFDIFLFLVNQERDLEAAWDWAKAFETDAGGHHHLTGLFLAWWQQAWILGIKGDYQNAFTLYQKSIEVCERIGNSLHVSAFHGYKGMLHFNCGNLDEAESLTRVALEGLEQVGELRFLSRICYQAGDISMCQHHWRDAIFHYQKNLEIAKALGNPLLLALNHFRLGKAYLKQGDYPQALQFYESSVKEVIGLLLQRGVYYGVDPVSLFSNALSGLENTYIALGTPERFASFCREFQARHAASLATCGLHQWHLESSKPSAEFAHLAFADDFASFTPGSYPTQRGGEWNWMDEFGDCAVTSHLSGHRLEISAANGRDLDGLNMGAPRVTREVSGDFAVAVRISPGSDERPRMGGLLIWKDKENFLRFDEGTYGQHEVRLHGSVDRRYQVTGRGLLPADSNGTVYLRLERSGDEFRAYCSTDGENWFTCGKMTLTMEDPIEIGIHAIGMIDRTIYCGAYKEGTATVFRRFRIWMRN